MLEVQASLKTARARHNSNKPMPASAAATYCRGIPHMRDLLLPLLRPPGALPRKHSISAQAHMQAPRRCAWY